MSEVPLKYNAEQTEELEKYEDIKGSILTDDEKHDAREAFILKYMLKHGHSKRSIIAKLSKMGIYVSRPKRSKVTNEEPETKKQMLGRVASSLGIDPTLLDGLDKGPKLSLQNLIKTLEMRLK